MTVLQGWLVAYHGIGADFDPKIVDIIGICIDVEVDYHLSKCSTLLGFVGAGPSSGPSFWLYPHYFVRKDNPVLRGPCKFSPFGGLVIMQITPIPNRDILS
jgi:hypothetical protein